MITASPFAQALGEYSETRKAFKVAIVAPVHIQPSEKWINALNAACNLATIIIVDDSDGKVRLPATWDVYDYQRQREEMGDELYAQFEQFHKSSACKNFGTWIAYHRGFDPIIVIDSDCIIPPDFVGKHIEQLFMHAGQGWSNPLEGTGLYSRGYPYQMRGLQKWAHMGLWTNELDLYGTDRLHTPIFAREPASLKTINAQFFPLSGMNVSFRRDAIPQMLFLPNFEYEGMRFSRHDDIWGGYIFQKICQMNNKALSYGEPFVYHDTVVIPEDDAQEEKAMIKWEDEFYNDVDFAFSHGTENYGGLAHSPMDIALFEPLRLAFQFWYNAFDYE